MKNEPAPTLLAIVDDEKSFLTALQDLIESEGMSALSFDCAEQFLVSGARHKVACLIADVGMPGMSGIELQATLRADGCQTPIIFITASQEERTCAKALKAGAIGVLSKPFNEECLIEYIHTALAANNTLKVARPAMTTRQGSTPHLHAGVA